MGLSFYKELVYDTFLSHKDWFKEEEEYMDYRIGLDIGITSVGWAVLLNNSQDEPVHIMDLGVRIFDRAEIPKTGESLAAPRRQARSARRRLRRRKHRLDRIKWLLQQEQVIEIEAFTKRYQSGNLPDVYRLRYEALDRRLTGDEFAQVLLHIAKHRGFRSTRKAELKESESGAVLSATNKNKALMEEKGYRTVGEMIYCDEAFHTACPWNDNGYILSPRNKVEDYKHTILRKMLEEEVKTIFCKQRELGNSKANERLEERYIEIMTSQRSFDQGPGNQPDGSKSPYALDGFSDRVGKCTFEKEEPRASKGTYSAELFVALQKINHLRLTDISGKKRSLTPEEREILVNLLYTTKELKYTAVRKQLGLDDNYRFHSLNYSTKKGQTSEEQIKAVEKAKFVSMPSYHSYMKIVSDMTEQMTEEGLAEFLDEIGRILTLYKNDDSRSQQLIKLGLSTEKIDALLELSPSGFQRVSVKAIRKMLPFLKEGMIYNEACDAAGYDFKGDEGREKQRLIKGDVLQEVLEDITNPVVKRSVSQTVKVVNAIIRKFGSPQSIHIELSREMSKNFDERKKLDNSMKERETENEKFKKIIQGYGVPHPKGQDIVKYRLWVEQDGYCLYSGEKIPIEELFEPGYDVDHILPYSITFDDTYRNKVLVTAQENRQKGNRTPYEYMGENEPKWDEFEQRVHVLVHDYRKQMKLLKKNFTEEEKSEFKERNLTDTKYITTVVYNLFRRHLIMEPFHNKDKKKQVVAVNGAVTAYLRKRWGLQAKNRDIDTHHAQDAIIVACCTDGMIQKISKSVQAREMAYSKDCKMVDVRTGEIIDRANFTKDHWDETFGVQIDKPWYYFKQEIDIRMGTEPKEFICTHRDVEKELDYPQEIYDYIRPIFVSRMPNHKVTGAAHKDTVRSPRHFKEGKGVFEQGGYVLTKKSITDLKLNKDGEIEGYYNKESDLLLYNALKRQLQLYDNIGKKAFAEEFHKPKADGTPGPAVKKVKIYDKLTCGVAVNNGTGIAENGGMVRIDVFQVKGKYYFVPIYTADVVKKRLPNRAATAHKPYDAWKEMDDKDFLFSLYSRDLVHIEAKIGKQIKLMGNEKIAQQELYAYYTSSNISTASISGITHNGEYSFESVGIQSLELLEKCQVDTLGNISIVKKETRKGFH